jgi:ferric iron reductase protein FhuF
MSQPPELGDRPGAAALADAARIGPYFRLLLDPDQRWTRVSEFAADRERLSAVIADERRRMAVAAGADEAAVEPRAAASLWHLGFAARIVSPALGAAALSGWVPQLGAIRWRHDPAGEPEPLAIRVDDITGTPVSDPSSAAAAIHEGVVDNVLVPLTTTVAEVGSVSEHVLWGNVWSAVAGAAAVIAMTRPEARSRATSIADAVVSTSRQPLAGRYDAVGRYRRDTCCLYYRLPRGGLCGDCVLRRIPPAARQSR